MEKLPFQNNEAAARYRKRQREAKMITHSELDTLLKRNEELKAEIETLQQEINTLKETFRLRMANSEQDFLYIAIIICPDILSIIKNYIKMLKFNTRKLFENYFLKKH